MNMFGNYLNNYFNDFNRNHYFITIIFGLLLTTFFILIEAEIIYVFGDSLSKILKKYRKFLL